MRFVNKSIQFLVTLLAVVSSTAVTHNVTAAVYHIFNLGFPKSGSSSFFEYLQCRLHNNASHGGSLYSPSPLISHYTCGRKSFMGSREFQTCGECIQRAAASDSHLSLQLSCSGAKAFTQMDYANATHCTFPQIEYLEYLIQSYPHAKFVLLTRPVLRWLHSVKNFFDLKLRLEACLHRRPSLFPGLIVSDLASDLVPVSLAAIKGKKNSSGGGGVHDTILAKWYAWHQTRVEQIFKKKNQTEKLLIVDVEDDVSSVQDRLDSFLGLSSDHKSEQSHRLALVQCWRHANKSPKRRLDS